MSFSKHWKPSEPAPNCFSKHWKVMLLVLGLSLQASAQIEGMEISGFRVPEYDEQGQMTAQLFGDHAELGSDGLVKIEGVRVELYRDGEVFMDVLSPRCFYNQKTRKVDSEAAVSAEMDGARLTGIGYRLDVDARTVHVLSDSRLAFTDGTQQSGLGLDMGSGGSTNETVITSRELFLDYNGRSAKFNDAVRIENEETLLECEKLDVFFNDDNELEKAVAESSVMIRNREMTMRCGALDVAFTGENEIDRAFADSSVVISNAEWTVSGEQGTLMYMERRALLEGGVQVESKELNMTCATLNLSFDENNEINWIEALGEVKILNEGREAYAGKAVFDVKTDEFILEENPKLVDGRNLLMGDRIRFWRSTGRMVCEPARAVIFPGTTFETQIFEK